MRKTRGVVTHSNTQLNRSAKKNNGCDRNIVGMVNNDIPTTIGDIANNFQTAAAEETPFNDDDKDALTLVTVCTVKRKSEMQGALVKPFIKV